MSPKKKSYSSRLRTRGGISVRKKWTKTMQERRTHSPCPSCGIKAVGRLSVGIWRCGKCGYTFTGGAYSAKTRIV